jgi:hypothetical protein
MFKWFLKGLSNRQTRCFPAAYLLLMLASLLYAQPLQTAEDILPPPVPQKGGSYFPSRGVVKALAIFVQFADDQTNPTAEAWPVDTGPAYLHSVIDSSLAVQSNKGNLTHYFRVMSFNQLKIIGDAVWVKTKHPKQYYLDKNQHFGDINKEILQALDESVDYRQYDHWTFGVNRHKAEPDGVIDLIFIVYRESFYGQFNLHNGISALFYDGKDIFVENRQLRIKQGFPGSGFTLDGGISGFRTDRAAHELGHKLIGAGHPTYHNDPPGVKNYAFWGLLHSRSEMLNAINRTWLGWSELPDMSGDSLVITLADFLTTGDAFRIPIPGTHDEAFVLENHQCLLPFDKPNKYGEGRGLYIYHVKGNGPLPKYDLESASGNFDWENPYWIQNPWGLRATDSIPVFRRKAPNAAGLDALDALPTQKIDMGRNRYIYFKHFAEDSAGVPLLTRRVYGHPDDAFRPTGKRRFAPDTNPASHRWDNQTPTGISVEIIDALNIENSEVYVIKILSGKTSDRSK